jgi:hypothetical protein
MRMSYLTIKSLPEPVIVAVIGTHFDGIHVRAESEIELDWYAQDINAVRRVYQNVVAHHLSSHVEIAADDAEFRVAE